MENRTGRLHGRSFVSVFVLLGERHRSTNLGWRSWSRVQRGCGCSGFHQPIRASPARQDRILVLVIVSIPVGTKFASSIEQKEEKQRSWKKERYLLSGYRRSSASLSLESIRLSSNSASSASLDTDDLDPWSGSLDLSLESSS